MIKAGKRAKLTAASLNFNSNENIFIGDHLIGAAVKALKTAKNLRNEGKILAVWTFNGQVFIRKTEESQAIKIMEESQLAAFKEIIHGHRQSNSTNIVTRSAKKKI